MSGSEADREAPGPAEQRAGGQPAGLSDPRRVRRHRHHRSVFSRILFSPRRRS